ncbi:alpha-1,6-mannosyltransferase Och1 [Elasticomyces elasticus]|uniref:Alpha-1,6-mannosyltransferase Och1 n=1 Tax=Exophiala sideris TaxID=1016849 RepID=A0ABR0JLQ5_9EURO|nr:alpha-1,6-mannosyltransferase Och1 [Elasticomyces elasticus]KAK5036520.1 alpha-1,6-mannosyltransferase Och1 [Exophiala sideris]KAK5041651.1 alpha-1,6-mannosyltransferase Och1 [Exophiala sideris]KAK5066903.1 alpha-1,6-mannosyltransferase Och1 [Exophiala sideris]KAK5184962.1 alpha-1,6-mannosyltransferase Och1 [Eurotiomycetes sp. CCFEE 6388]
MVISTTTKRVALVAVVLLTLFLLLRPTSSSLSDAPALESSPKEPAQASRSYPPPKPSKKIQQPDEQTLRELASKPLRDRLRYHFPYDIESKFPAYVWQTWKEGPGSGQFEERLRPFEASWSTLHPGFVHEVITDDAAVHLVNYLFASVPEVTEAYEAMPLPVLKADFFRYLILLARGGIYSDIDTEALKSVVDWLPPNLDKSTVGLVVGIEADPDRPDWSEWYARRIQFCQWTIQSKPGHPVMRDIVATITEDTLAMKKVGNLPKGQKPSKSIMEFTGPGVWTDAVFSYFNNKEYFDFSSRKSNVTYSDFFGVQEHKKIGDVVVLPITSFSPGVGQMGAEGTDHPMAFVKHEFDGSWKPQSERMKGGR